MGLIDRRIAIALVVVGVLLMAWVRFAGLTRGASDFTASETETTAFYAFPPDEETLIRAALDLDCPLDPPLTAYGMLPMYLARAVLVGVEPFDAGPAARQRIYLRVRVLAALLSCALPVLVFWLGRRTMGAGPALLAELSVVYARVLVTDSFFDRPLLYDGDLRPLDPVADVFMVLGVENRHWY